MNAERFMNQEILGIELENFIPLRTIKVALFQFIVSCSLELLLIVLFYVRDHQQNECSQMVVILFVQAALWLITLICDHYFRLSHSYLRLAGHFTFYKSLNQLSGVFLYIVSFANAIILIIIGILLQLNNNMICLCDNLLSPAYIIFYLFSFEIILLTFYYISYMTTVTSFNNVKPISDIERYECWFTADENQLRSEVGYRNGGEQIATFLEKQADLIEYYKVANNDLSRKLEHFYKNIIQYYTVHPPPNVVDAREIL